MSSTLDNTADGAAPTVTRQWPTGEDPWDFDAPEELRTWVYREGSADDQPLRSGEAGYVAKIVGAIDPEIIKQRLGGGVYRLVIKRGRLSTSRNLTVAGAPRVLAMEPDAAPTSTSPARMSESIAAPTVDMIAEAVTRAMLPALERIAGAGAQRDPFEMALRLTEAMRTGAAPREDSHALARELVKIHTDALREGQQLAGGGRSIGDAIVEIGPALVNGFEKLIDARQAVPTPIATAASSPATPSPQALSDLVIAGQVAQAITNGTDPADFVSVLEVLYPDTVTAQLTLVPAEMLVERLRVFGKQFPVLTGEQLAPFVAAVIEVLKSPAPTEGDAAAS